MWLPTRQLDTQARCKLPKLSERLAILSQIKGESELQMVTHQLVRLAQLSSPKGLEVSTMNWWEKGKTISH